MKLKLPSLSPKTKRLLPYLVCLGVLASVLLFGRSFLFHRFSQKLFVREMTRDTISLHYSLAKPDRFGIRNYPVTLPLPDSRSPEEVTEEIRSDLDRLEYYVSDYGVFQNTLSDADRYGAALLRRELRDALALSAFPYYDDPLTPGSGAQCQLPILLSEYTFRTRRDVEDYLALLGQTPEYYQALLKYAQQRSAAGLSSCRDSILDAASQCDVSASAEALRQGEHLLQSTFTSRLQELMKEHRISAAEAEAFQAENRRLLSEALLPALTDLGDGLRELAKSAPEAPSGLASLPRGRDYYSALLTAVTGTSRSPEEIRSLLAQTLEQEWDTLVRLIRDYPAVLPALREGTYRDLGFESTEQVVQDLRRGLPENHPLIDGCCLPMVTVKTVSPGLQPHTAPAFYLTAPIDDTDTNVIYINPSDTTDQLELYTTLAHEGYPGHLYQNAYCADSILSIKNNRLRQLCSCGGYIEGWALYVETNAYDRASTLVRNRGRVADAVCIQLEKHNRSLQLCLYSLLDLMIHYDGANPEQVANLLKSFGISDPAIASRIYRYICENPATYPKYFLGFLEITELKDYARSLWQEKYTDRSFHAFLLQNGPADFENLKLQLETTSSPNLPKQE